MLTLYKNFDTDRLELLDLMALSVFGDLLAEKYESNGLEVPASVQNKNQKLALTIKAKVNDQLQNKIQDVSGRLESLKSPSEKKADLTKQLEKLRKQLVQV